MQHCPTAISTDHLSKRFGAVLALEDLTLSVPSGALYGFLGPNGAGKTTAIRLLLGFIRPTSGAARIRGHDCWHDGVRARSTLGFLVQPDQLYADMSGQAHLELAARLSNREPVLRDMLLDTLELPAGALDRRLGTYSKGMRQKLALTLAIQHDPAVLILDEPSDGLDPLTQRRFEELLLDRHAVGRTILMSSHDLSEVDRLCERVAIVRAGRLVAEERVATLKGRQSRRLSVPLASMGVLGGIPYLTLVGRDAETAIYLVEGELAPVLAALAQARVGDVTLTPPSLDDIFLAFYRDEDRA